jgi:hypothetical protein
MDNMAQDNESTAYKHGSGNASTYNELEQAVHINMGPEMFR